MTNKGILYALLWQQLPILMACLLVMGSGLPATGADAQMKLASETLIEIAGGTGSQAWRIRIGTQDSYKKQFVSAGDNRAWFSHGGWLRLFDTEGGMAIGRWHFPGEIVGLVPAENRVQVEVEDKLNDQIFHRTVSFDPEAGAAVLYWPTGSLLLNRVPFTEVESAWRAPGKAILLSERWEAPAEQDVKELIPELEEAVRRDPTAPLLRLALWRLLHTVGDARAPAVLEKALRITTTDFTETLLIAGLLEQLGEREPARAAFELGYRNFLDRGNDPRLVMALIGKMILYRPWVAKLPDLSTGHGRELMERNYRLAPRCEAADFAWQIYADFLEKNGQTEEAVKWRARAKEAAPTSVFLMPRSATLLSDWTILLVMASMIAAGLYVILLWIRYRPQRRADSAARKDQGRLGRAFSSLSFQYWSRSQRIVLLSVMIVAWIATGFVAGIMRGISRAAELPISFGMGSLAGPATVWFLENRLPPTPERDLLRATAYHQSGETEQAEGLYRSLPDFAESWNNLGVLLKDAGRDQEAQQAFEKALQLDSGLAEAALNLGRPLQGIWAEQYARYFPGRPMLAPPGADRLAPAFFGGSMGKTLLRALAGPFVGASPWKAFGAVGLMGSDAPVTKVLTGIFVAALGLAVVMFFIPHRDVTQPPGRIFPVFEVLLPGVSPSWGALGGLALVAWISLAFQTLLILGRGTPYLLTSIALPNLSRPYGLPEADFSSVLRIINPNWVWVYLAPAVLFAVNLALVMASRRSRGEASRTEQP